MIGKLFFLLVLLVSQVAGAQYSEAIKVAKEGQCNRIIFLDVQRAVESKSGGTAWCLMK